MVNEESALNIQRDLDFAFNWTQDWLIKLNFDKCMVMNYGHNNEKRHFSIHGIQFHESDTERDLDVIFFYRFEMEKSSFDCNKQCESDAR